MLCAASPVSASYEMATLVGILYRIPTIALPNFLTLTLTPSNQIIHPGRVYSVWKNWDGKTPVDAKSVPLLYEDLDEDSA